MRRSLLRLMTAILLLAVATPNAVGQITEVLPEFPITGLTGNIAIYPPEVDVVSQVMDREAVPFQDPLVDESVEAGPWTEGPGDPPWAPGSLEQDAHSAKFKLTPRASVPGGATNTLGIGFDLVAFDAWDAGAATPSGAGVAHDDWGAGESMDDWGPSSSDAQGAEWTTKFNLSKDEPEYVDGDSIELTVKLGGNADIWQAVSNVPELDDDGWNSARLSGDVSFSTDQGSDGFVGEPPLSASTFNLTTHASVVGGSLVVSSPSDDAITTLYPDALIGFDVAKTQYHFDLELNVSLKPGVESFLATPSIFAGVMIDPQGDEAGSGLVVFDAQNTFSLSVTSSTPGVTVQLAGAPVIPEPSALLVWALLGALGLGAAWWRRPRARPGSG